VIKGERGTLVSAGEASVFRPDGSGKTVLVARVQAIDRIEAAK
jgi:hypothetical protein